MSVYDKSGAILSAVYDKSGVALQNAYDKGGVEIFSGETPDYDEYSSEYQHTILRARDEWKTQYRGNENVVPLIVDTDQHRYYHYAKSTFSYLGLAIKWSEISAHVNLGDTCGSRYGTGDLNDMISCLSPIPATKQINVAGNHDVATSPPEGSSASYGVLDDTGFTYLQETYFNNSNYNGGNYNHRYGNRGNEYIIDEEHKIKYCVFTTWYFATPTIFSAPLMNGDAIEAWIDMLSSIDDYDIIILMHIQPYYYQQWYAPDVDGLGFRAYGRFLADRNNRVEPYTQLNDFLADRKAKRAGTIVDSSGVSHSYDFTGCTSDLLCAMAGHEHLDLYQYSSDSNVPVILFDAMGYDYHPIFMVNVDRDNEKIDVWKVDESPTFYKFSIPFDEVKYPYTGISLDKTEMTISVGESATLTPTISLAQEDESAPTWIPAWTVRVGSTISNSVARCSNGVVTGVAAGTCRVIASVVGYSAECIVTVVD